MFHGAHLRVRRGTQRSAFRSFFGSVNTGNKRPLHRGIAFTAVSGVLLLIGGILTWIGFSNVLGTIRVTNVGPLLMAVALLLFLVSIRQFLVARRQSTQNEHDIEQLGNGGIAAVVIDREEVDGTVTVIMDTIDPSMPEVVRDDSENVAPPAYTEVTESSIHDRVNISDYVHECIHSDPPPSYDEATQGSTEQPVDDDYDAAFREEIIPAEDNGTSTSVIK